MGQRQSKTGIISIAQKVMGSVEPLTESNPYISKPIIKPDFDYKGKLNHPKWQRKRLEIMQRDDFKCVLCNDTETMLQIHHLEYATSGNPWDVENDKLITLCKHCHHETEIRIKDGFKDCINPGKIVKILNDKNERYSFLISNRKISLNVFDFKDNIIAGCAIENEAFDKLKALL